MLETSEDIALQYCGILYMFMVGVVPRANTLVGGGGGGGGNLLYPTVQTSVKFCLYAEPYLRQLSTLGNVTDFKAVSTDFRQLVRQMKKRKKKRETVKFGLLKGQPFFYLILSGIVFS